MRTTCGLFTRAHRWLRLWAAAMAVILVTSLVPTATFADTAPPSVEAAASFLQQLGVVQGDEHGDMLLNSTLTRAQMAALLVRLLGKEDVAQLVKASSSFPDTNGHWAAGYITVAHNLNLVKGYEDGTFKPDAPVRYAELLTLLLRVLGKEPTTGSWPTNVITAAVDLGIQPTGVQLGTAALQPAVRGSVFQSLYLAGTRVPVDAQGKTLFQTYLDKEAPTITLDTLPSAVTTDTVTISGRTSGASSVSVNGQVVNMDTTGYFHTDVRLTPGANSIQVEAFDKVNNRSVKTVSVVRATTPASIDVSGPATVKAGQVGQYTVHIIDATGADLGSQGLQVDVVGNIGTFDVKTTSLKAAAVGTSGKLVFKAGNITKEMAVVVSGPSAAAKALKLTDVSTIFALNRDQTIQVQAVDADGNLVSDDYDRSVSLSLSGLSGATVTSTPVTTKGGVATFTVRSTNGGAATVRATSTGLTSIDATVQFATSRRLVLFTDVARLLPDGSSQAVVTGRLEDENGNTVTYNDSQNLVVKLSVTGPGTLVDGTLTLQRGYASTTFDQGIVEATGNEGTVTISGTVTSGQAYTVVPVSLNVSTPRLTSDSSLVITGPASTTIGNLVTYSLRVLDKNGDTVTDGSFAFQVSVTTTNDETVTNGIPDGVEVYLGDTSENPVDDSYSESSTSDGSDVIGRTVDGTATIKVRYNKSGQVTIKPIAKGATNSAINSLGEEGTAQSSTIVPSDHLIGATTSFQGTPAGLKLEADSSLGNGQPGAAVGVGTSNTIKVRVRVVDEDGNWVPGVTNYSVTLRKTGTNTTITGTNPVTTRNGYAEFTVRANTTTGIDTYDATATKISGSTPASLDSTAYPDLAVEVENHVPVLPDDTDTIISSVSGYKGDSLKEPNFVASDDDGMAIVLNPIPDENWAVVKVYREGSSTVVFTSGAVDLNDTQVIKVPKSLLKGSYRWQVSVRNSRGESSTKSSFSPTVVSANVLSGATISYAKFNAVFGNTDATPNVLTVYASSLSCTGTIYPDRLKIVAGGNEMSLGDAIAYLGSSPTANCTSGSTSQFQLVLTDSQVNRLYSADFATASTVIEADAGWYESPNREQAAADTTGNKVTPLAYIGRAEIDLTGKKLTLYGSGFSYTSASLDANTITIRDGSTHSEIKLLTTGTTLTKNAGTPSRSGDTKYVIPLLDNAITAFTNGSFSGNDITVEAAPGWFKESNYKAPAQSAQLYQQVTITQVHYDQAHDKIQIYGRGFFDGQGSNDGIVVNPAMMKIMDWDAVTTELLLAGATPTVVSDTLIELALSPGQITQYVPANFDGSNIFFSAQDGWYVSSRSLPAAGTSNPTTYGVNAPQP